MKVITTEKTPIKSWCTDLEEGALEQAKNIANLPFIYKHVALMPDCHQGFGMPIGGVLATKYVVIPNAIGVDIGCGLCAVKTGIKEINTEKLKRIMDEIRKVIPLGFNRHAEPQDSDYMPSMCKNTYDEEEMKKLYPICFREYNKALCQLGTLGGGDHFIEIQKGSDGYIWIMIHSGSRNLGLQVANYYNNIAKEFNLKNYSQVPKEWDLAFLLIDSREARRYLEEMQYCLDFALANRKLMMDRIINIFQEEFRYVNYDEPINIHHNYVTQEHHFGKNVWVHRKGATLAREGIRGIIPGSQGSSSYIVKGKGNLESFTSCSHGAGRKMGRYQAIRELDIKKEIKNLEEQGVIHSIRNEKDLDEAPGAYKDIEEVMENQKDLVDILVELKPLAVVKG